MKLTQQCMNCCPTIRNRRGATVAVATVALCSTALLYYLWKYYRRSVNRLNLLQLLNVKKEEGITYYREKKYAEAIEIFQDAITLARSYINDRERPVKIDGNKHEQILTIMANLYNNMAACNESMGSIEECILNCTKAISLKPSYTKAIHRRARNYFQQKQLKEALDDYLDLLDVTSPDKLQLLQLDIDKVAEALIRDELDNHLNETPTMRKPIAQHIVSQWMWSTVVNDPILKEIEGFDDKSIHEGIDPALSLLKAGKYDEIFDCAISLVHDETSPILERIKAALLASRFAYYHNMKIKSRELAQEFNAMWEQLDAQTKSSNKKLKTAYYALMVIVSEVPTNQLILIAEEAINLEPGNADPLMALASRLLDDGQDDAIALQLFKRAEEVESKNPYLRYYVIYVTFLIALHERNISGIHSSIASLESAIESVPKPPVFALVLLCKVGMMLDNASLALESVKKALVIMPNCAYALYLYGVLNQNPEDLFVPEKLITYAKRIEKVMKKVIEVDKNYWEPYRMLAKLCIDRQDFDAALEYLTMAVNLARSKEELEVLLKERLMANAFKERISIGKLAGIPKAPY